MDNPKNDSYYISKAIEDIDIIVSYSNNMSYDEFVENRQRNDAIMFRLVQMVESIKNISKEFRQEHSEVPWGDIIGFRNGLVHEYGKTDYHSVYTIVTKDIIELRKALLDK